MWPYLEVVTFSLMAVPGGQRAKRSFWWSVVIATEPSLCVLSTLESLWIPPWLFLLPKKTTLVSWLREVSGSVLDFYLSHTRKFWEAFTGQSKRPAKFPPSITKAYIRSSSCLATRGAEYELIPVNHFHECLGHTHNSNHRMYLHIRASRCACLRGEVLELWGTSEKYQGVYGNTVDPVPPVYYSVIWGGVQENAPFCQSLL